MLCDTETEDHIAACWDLSFGPQSSLSDVGGHVCNKSSCKEADYVGIVLDETPPILKNGYRLYETDAGRYVFRVTILYFRWV